tara:strand:- start:18 stop:380 length:363 start_codon:yes stop_codon:yes gene_type:complete
MDSQRQKKVSALIKKDLAKIIDSILRNRVFHGVLVSVTNVKTTPDLSQCTVFLSVFPSRKTTDIINFLENNKFEIKQKFISLVRAQLRVMPEIEFLIDDSLDYIEGIENALRNGGKNPIK